MLTGSYSACDLLLLVSCREGNCLLFGVSVVAVVLAWPGYCYAVIVMLLLLCCGIDLSFGLSFFFLLPEQR